MYIADLHIHSKYSRATSRDCVPEQLDFWARRKGIDLLGTGDFTHPAWRKELEEKLIPAEEGLYRLRDELCQQPAGVAGEPHQPRFVLSGEISSIYKKNGKVRKVHNVILLPSLEAADTLAHKLEAIGNIHSDGRPILGLDSRDLLEITLESCPEAVFIPAHIWTPHFSLFGAFSGFDTIEECFEDLTPYIHALETGLSSDPPMNWQISALDGYTLVSNSDAHSPQKLGREANLLEGPVSYPALSHAIQTGEGFAGTLEFFPEEGKYHWDGHRNCGVCLEPSQTDQYEGRCPVCGKKLTIGVQHRVDQLSDRENGYRPKGAKPFESLVPLPEVIAACTGVSAASKKTAARYEQMLHTLGDEFYILRKAPIEDIERAAGKGVAEGIRRLRAGQVERSPGFDGEYGKITLLSPDEMDMLVGQTSLFGKEEKNLKRTRSRVSASQREKKTAPSVEKDENASEDLLSGLNEEQRQAVTATEPTVAVIAGPGTGKTKTLITRIAYLVEQMRVRPEQIGAVTFTNQAAEEMRQRLEAQFDDKKRVKAMTIGTFHSICLKMLGKKGAALLDTPAALETAAQVIQEMDLKLKPSAFLQEVSRKKNGVQGEEAFSEEAFARYQQLLEEAGALDFDDLLLAGLKLAEEKGKGFDYLLVDEFQDIAPVQYQLIRRWSQGRKGLFVIGDPDQSIYGFRDSDAHCFERLQEDMSGLRTIRLRINYRSTPQILQSALAVIEENGGEPRLLQAHGAGEKRVCLVTSESELSEGIFIAKEIGRMVGGVDMLDAGALLSEGEGEGTRSFSDIAILYRTHHQSRVLESCLRHEGIPYIVHGREDFLEEEGVRGILCFFRWLTQPRDVLSLRGCLGLLWHCPEDLCRSVGEAWSLLEGQDTAEKVTQILSQFENTGLLREWGRLAQDFTPRVKKDNPRKLIEALAEECGLEGKKPVEKLQNMAVFDKTMAAFLENLALGSEGDLRRSPVKTYHSGAVRLMTLHGAKGLEFPVVFLSGVKKGSIPLESPRHPVDMEEERRLFYVGMTRAKEELVLMTSQEPSAFLNSIPGQLLQREKDGAKRQPAMKQLSFF